MCLIDFGLLFHDLIDGAQVVAQSGGKLERVGDITARSAALQDIQEALGMDQAPLR